MIVLNVTKDESVNWKYLMLSVSHPDLRTYIQVNWYGYPNIEPKHLEQGLQNDLQKLSHFLE